MDQRDDMNDRTTARNQMDASVGTGPTGGEPDGWPYAMAPASAELPATQRVPSTVVGNTLPLPVLSVPEGDRVQQTSGKFISPSPGNTPQMVQTLAALYQSSRRSRNNTPVTGVKPKAPIVLPPPPPLYQKNGSDDDNRQTMITSTAGKGSNDSSIMTGSIGSPAFGLDYSTRSMMSTANAIMTLSMQTQRPEPPHTTHVAAQPNLSEDYIIEDIEESRVDEYGHIHRDAALTVPSLSSGSAATDLSEILTGNKLEGENGASLKRSPPFELNTEMNSEPPRKKPSILRGDMTATPSMSIKSGVSFDVIAYRSSRLSALTTDSGSQIPEDLRDENHEGTSQDIEFQMPLKGEDTLDETEREREERIIRRKIQRLLLIKHCSTCQHQSTPVNEIHIPQSSVPGICKPCDETEPDYTSSVCPVTSRCAEGKALCAHIRTCKLPDCKYKWCITSREVLGHYMSCKDRTCRICEPVRHKGRKRKIDPPENVDIVRRCSSLETNDLWIENEQTGDFSVGQLELTRI